MAITIDHLQKRYVAPDGSVVPVIDVERFSLNDGEQAALIGTSGSGKTTLLHLIAGILAPDSGRILFGSPDVLASLNAPVAAQAQQGSGGGTVDYRSAPSAPLPSGVVDVAALSEAQRDVFRGRYIGYIFQTHHLLGGFTALENVLLGMSFTGRQHDPAWARHLLEEVGLKDRLDYRPSKLSVGQQQRVAVARALANRPNLVLADEPTGALDAKNAQQVLELIRKLCSEVGASLMMVTHDLDMAHQLPRVVSLKDVNRAAA